MASKKPVAVKATSAFGGIVIYDFEYGIDDYVIWANEYEGKPGKMRRSKIHYTTRSDRAYFKNNGRREYLDDFMRIGGF